LPSQVNEISEADESSALQSANLRRGSESHAGSIKSAQVKEDEVEVPELATLSKEKSKIYNTDEHPIPARSPPKTK